MELGRSSKFLFDCFISRKYGTPVSVPSDVPYDPSDFRRCYYVYKKAFNSNRIELQEVLEIAGKFDYRWNAIKDNWDELESLYLMETNNDTIYGDAPKLYKALREVHTKMYIYELIKDMTIDRRN